MKQSTQNILSEKITSSHKLAAREGIRRTTCALKSANDVTRAEVMHLHEVPHTCRIHIHEITLEGSKIADST